MQSDGERLPLAVKDLGSCDLYPQSLQHNPNGRFVTVCGDGEYIIYTALAWRNKSFGSALEFVWGNESNDFAIRSAPCPLSAHCELESPVCCCCWSSQVTAVQYGGSELLPYTVVLLQCCGTVHWLPLAAGCQRWASCHSWGSREGVAGGGGRGASTSGIASTVNWCSTS